MEADADAAEPTPTLPDPLPPALVEPDASGRAVACAANSLRLPLSIDGQPVTVASHITSSGDSLYIVADGGLYRMARRAADAGVPQWQAVLAPGQDVAGRTVQEISGVDATRSGVIVALDKAGHIYRYDPGMDAATLSYRAEPSDDSEANNQFVALTTDFGGRAAVLDPLYGALWAPTGLQALETTASALSLSEAIDVASSGSLFYALLRDGSLTAQTTAYGAAEWAPPPEGDALLLSVFVSPHLGPDAVFVVDALNRTVSGRRAEDGEPVAQYALDFEGMGLLRDATFGGGRLYGVADGELFVFPGPAGDTPPEPCPEPDPPPPTLYGVDVLAATKGWAYPIEGGNLPDWAGLYPGAIRLYRMGVHRGMDVYHWDAPDGFDNGYPVIAPAGGTVERVTLGYEEITRREFDRLTTEAVTAGYTPADSLERFAGRQVWLDHGGGVRSAYLHLENIPRGIVTGAFVEPGTVIGTVGVSGTEGEARPGSAAAHLHAEIWLGEHYIGEYLSLPETMWWFEQIFGPAIDAANGEDEDATPDPEELDATG